MQLASDGALTGVSCLSLDCATITEMEGEIISEKHGEDRVGGDNILYVHVCVCLGVWGMGLLPSVDDSWNDFERTSGEVTLRFRLISS